MRRAAAGSTERSKAVSRPATSTPSAARHGLLLPTIWCAQHPELLRRRAAQEGWAPSSFVSSRSNRSRRPAASIADFMDDGTLPAPLGSSPNSGTWVSASLSATDCLRRRAFCSPNGRPRRQKQLRPAFSAPLSCPSTVVRLPLRRCQRARAR
jgi:hypothetical protein